MRHRHRRCDSTLQWPTWPASTAFAAIHSASTAKAASACSPKPPPPNPPPPPSPPTSPVVAIAQGASHNCALVDGSSPYITCWGSNYWYQTGNKVHYSVTAHTNRNTDRLVPTKADITGTSFTALAAGYDGTCVNNGDVPYCWGSYGGHTTYMPQTFYYFNAAFTQEPEDKAIMFCFGQQHFCALLVTGKVHCSGSNAYGQCGDPFCCSTGSLSSPCTSCGNRNIATVGMSGTVSQVKCGSYATFAIRGTGELLAWGMGQAGLLGTGSTDNEFVPATINLGKAVTTVAPGEHHTCALLEDASVKCWVRYNMDKTQQVLFSVEHIAVPFHLHLLGHA